MILVAYSAFNLGMYVEKGWKEDKNFLRTVINIVTATFVR